jgi:hypothetical protein
MIHLDKIQTCHDEKNYWVQVWLGISLTNSISTLSFKRPSIWTTTALPKGKRSEALNSEIAKMTMMRNAQSHRGTDKPNHNKRKKNSIGQAVPEGQIAKLIAVRTDSRGYTQPDIHY